MPHWEILKPAQRTRPAQLRAVDWTDKQDRRGEEPNVPQYTLRTHESTNHDWQDPDSQRDNRDEPTPAWEEGLNKQAVDTGVGDQHNYRDAQQEVASEPEPRPQQLQRVEA